MFGWLKRRRRKKIRRQPFPVPWRTIIDRNIPACEALDEEEHRQLEGDVLVFLAEKEFEGCEGLEVTDEIRVTIAAQACLLLLGRPDDEYPSLKTILVYPAAYRVRSDDVEPDGTVREGYDTRLGESWYRGSVVLSWRDVRDGAEDERDGKNVVLHEFAHQLDAQTGNHNGAPRLDSRSRYEEWSRILGREYSELVEEVDRGRRTAIDPYGTENPAEFFAVVTEEFFEQPLQLAREHPELYAQLKSYYHQDPGERLRRKLQGHRA